ncbi:MAG: TIM barrel protein [Dehalococcoidia bacterium]|nr:TIM barrel protein [Dehalococcoidia bacterium]
MNHSLSLSTMSARGQYPDLYEFSRMAKGWGFTAVEANAFVKTPEMLERLAQGPLPIRSLHNPIPNAPSALGISSYDLSLCSLDEVERQEAVRVARGTIANAARLGARAVVLHMGHVPVDSETERLLHDLWHEGKTRTQEYFDVQWSIPERRARTAPQHVERALQTVRELEVSARENGVLLGIETRHNLHEVPNIDEMRLLLDEADPTVVGYWHDTGHAGTHQRIGFTTQEEWLRRYGSRMIGIHLHDIDRERDHQCPGRGEIDWALVARHVPESAIRVCEIGEWNGPDCLSTCPSFVHEIGLFSPNGASGASK